MTSEKICNFESGATCNSLSHPNLFSSQKKEIFRILDLLVVLSGFKNCKKIYMYCASWLLEAGFYGSLKDPDPKYRSGYITAHEMLR
jgi:hypothetical protein